MTRTLIKGALRVLLIAVLAIAAYLAAGIAGALWPGSAAAYPPGGGTREIRLIAGPIHYDILLPLDAETQARLAFANAAGVPINHPQARWAVVGWGSRAFYTTAGHYSDISARAVWTAATGDDGVLRIDALGDLSDDYPTLRLNITGAQYAQLLDAILDGVDRTPLPQAGLTATDKFFAAPGHFDLFRTCNAWLGRTLRAAGIPAGGWTPTTWSLRWALHWSGSLAD
jgi:uncharacterized protein (TIGR02117 family)